MFARVKTNKKAHLKSMSILTKCGSRIYLLLLIYFLCDYVVVVCCGKDLKEGKKIRISEPDVLKKAGQLFTLRSL